MTEQNAPQPSDAAPTAASPRPFEDLQKISAPCGKEVLGDEGDAVVGADRAGERLDLFVCSVLSDATRSEAQRLIQLPSTEASGVRVNDRREKPGYRIRVGDVVRIGRPAPQESHVLAEEIPLAVIFEDADVLVIDKPRGMVVHPAPGSESGTLVNAVLAHSDDLSGIGGETRPGIVHRLDKDTGGLLMVAKNDFAHRALQAQIQARTAERRYLALVWGVPGFAMATVEAPIGRHPADRKKMAVITDSHHTARAAQTDLFLREAFEGTFALLEAKLRTGRTHQIRVHCAYIHHPVVGDPLYDGERKVPGNAWTTPLRSRLEQAIASLHGQALHAYSLAFDHPRTGERLGFTVPLPEPLQQLLDLLRTASTD